MARKLKYNARLITLPPSHFSKPSSSFLSIHIYFLACNSCKIFNLFLITLRSENGTKSFSFFSISWNHSINICNMEIGNKGLNNFYSSIYISIEKLRAVRVGFINTKFSSARINAPTRRLRFIGVCRCRYCFIPCEMLVQNARKTILLDTD